MTSKISTWILIILFSTFIGAFFLLFVLIPDKTFSEQENRELAQLPKFTLQALAEKKFTTKFESYTTDQFPFRDTWTSAKAATELAIGKKENKGVYLCNGDTLLEKYERPAQAKLDENIAHVKRFAEALDKPVYFALVPSSSELHRDIVPKNAPNDSQKAVIVDSYAGSGARNIDILDSLSAHGDEYIYYRTDHHWTSLGAYYGYVALMEGMGYTPSPLSEFSPKTVTETFYGTVYSKSGMSWVEPDSIDIFAEQAAGTEVINYMENEPRVSAMYDFAFLEKKDKYAMFIGGNTPLLTIHTDKTEAPKILILRDSYMDSLLPFLQEHFSEIHVMDLRYYKTQLMNSSVSDYVHENNIDEVLICYSLATFGTDTNIFLLG